MPPAAFPVIQTEPVADGSVCKKSCEGCAVRSDAPPACCLRPAGRRPFESQPPRKNPARHTAHGIFGAGGGTRTHTMSPSADFESATSTIPSHRHIVRKPTQAPKLCVYHTSINRKFQDGISAFVPRKFIFTLPVRT